MNRYDLPDILYSSLKALGGRSDIVGLCKYVWEQYRTDLEHSGNLFYTWQYDIRWAATKLRRSGRMKPAEASPEGIWEVL